MHNNYRTALSVLLTAATLSIPAGAFATVGTLISVDLESSYGTEGSPFSGVDSEAATADPAFNAANVWNHLGSSGFNVVNPSYSNLVDSNGNPTGVGFAITGSISAYGFGDSTDALLSDYFYWNTPGAVSTSIDWVITGLVPSATYEFFANGSDSDANPPRSFSMLVDTNGDDNLGDETARTVVSPPGTLFMTVKADASGAIHGRGTAGQDEADWGGFQLLEVSVVPTEHSSWGRIKSLYEQ